MWEKTPGVYREERSGRFLNHGGLKFCCGVQRIDKGAREDVVPPGVQKEGVPETEEDVKILGAATNYRASPPGRSISVEE